MPTAWPSCSNAHRVEIGLGVVQQLATEGRGANAEQGRRVVVREVVSQGNRIVTLGEFERSRDENGGAAQRLLRLKLS